MFSSSLTCFLLACCSVSEWQWLIWIIFRNGVMGKSVVMTMILLYYTMGSLKEKKKEYGIIYYRFPILSKIQKHNLIYLVQFTWYASFLSGNGVWEVMISQILVIVPAVNRPSESTDILKFSLFNDFRSLNQDQGLYIN